MGKSFYSSLILFLLMFSCGEAEQEEKSVSEAELEKSEQIYLSSLRHSEMMKKIFMAHGGYDKWQEYKGVSFSRGKERYVVDLTNRKILLDSEGKLIGFDGKDVWVFPDTLDVVKSRFYHNLFFYFFAMPFVLGDPSIVYKNAQDISYFGQSNGAVKISYENGVGDSDKDNYVILYDKKTYRMTGLLYTVTYGTDSSTENYNLIRYNQWENSEEISLPTTLQWMEFDEKTKKEKVLKEVKFSDIRLTKNAPDSSQFEKRKGSIIAPI